MARDDHELPKVSPGFTVPYPSTPYEQATPETALRPFQGWPAHRVGNLLPFSTPLDTPCRTPMPGRDSCQHDSHSLYVYCIYFIYFLFGTMCSLGKQGDHLIPRHEGIAT
jgi:hypothetical protein